MLFSQAGYTMVNIPSLTRRPTLKLYTNPDFPINNLLLMRQCPTPQTFSFSFSNLPFFLIFPVFVSFLSLSSPFFLYPSKMLGKANSAEGSTPASNLRSRLGACLNLYPFVCSLCSRAFPSAQALGGHQNAHRKVRNAAQGLSLVQHQARMKEIILTPISLRVVAVDEDQIFEHLELSSRSPSTELELGLGRGQKNAQGLGCCPSEPGSSIDRYGNLGGPRHGKDKYHPYIKRRHQQVISCLELRLKTRVGQDAAFGVSTMARDTDQYAKAFYGGEDGTEMTSMGKIDLTLRL